MLDRKNVGTAQKRLARPNSIPAQHIYSYDIISKYHYKKHLIEFSLNGLKKEAPRNKKGNLKLMAPF